MPNKYHSLRLFISQPSYFIPLEIYQTTNHFEWVADENIFVNQTRCSRENNLHVISSFVLLLFVGLGFTLVRIEKQTTSFLIRQIGQDIAYDMGFVSNWGFQTGVCKRVIDSVVYTLYIKIFF